MVTSLTCISLKNTQRMSSSIKSHAPFKFTTNPLTPMSDQDRISPYYINTELSRLVRGIKKKTQLGDYKLIQCQILQI